MCVHHPSFEDNRMYAAFIKGTDEMLIGGGNDKLLPFVSMDPKNKPRQISVDGIMYNVEYRRVDIIVYEITEEKFRDDGEQTTYKKRAQCHFGVKRNPDIETTIDKASKISEERYAEFLADAVANAQAM